MEQQSLNQLLPQDIAPNLLRCQSPRILESGGSNVPEMLPSNPSVLGQED